MGKEYKKYVDEISPKPTYLKNYILAFIVGGIILSSIIDLPLHCVRKVAITCCKSVANPGYTNVFILTA